MSGQAESAPTSFGDIAALLANNPEADSPMVRLQNGDVVPADADNTPVVVDEDVHNLDPEDEHAPGPDQDEDEPPQRISRRDNGNAPANANERKGQISFTVKGDDGKEQTITVDRAELGSGYLRHADYTRKTQQLVREQREAAKLVEGKLTEGMGRAAQLTDFALKTINELCGFLSDADMARLKAADPQAWANERERVDTIMAKVKGLQDNMAEIARKGEEQAREAKKRALAECWDELTPEGIDAEKLVTIFKHAQTTYGIPEARFKNLDDPALVFLMRDSMELKAIRENADKVRKAAAKAPNAGPRSAPPRDSDPRGNFVRRAKAGTANLTDLGRLIGQLRG